MASEEQPSTPQSVDPVTLLTDCPECGHSICRSCVYDVFQELGLGATHQPWGQHRDLPGDQGRTINQHDQQMGTDPMMEELFQELEKKSCIPCLQCFEKGATNICIDCGECYCDACTAVHQESSDTRDHQLQFLPQPHLRVPSSSATIRPKSPTALPKSSLDSVHNPPHPQPCDDASSDKFGDAMAEWNEWVNKEMGLFQQASIKQKKVKTVLQDILSLGQQLLDREHADQQVIDAYQHHLPSFDVVQCPDPGTYILNAKGSDTCVEMKMETMKRRLCAIRKSDQHVNVLNAVEMIRTRLSQL